jgi:hypothetical protein
MSKFGSNWILRMPTPLHRQCRVQSSILGFTKMTQKHFPQELLQIIVDPSLGSRNRTGIHTMKTSWFIYSQELQTKPSDEKNMEMVFWELQRNLFVHYTPHKTAITGDAYAVMPWKLREAIREK